MTEEQFHMSVVDYLNILNLSIFWFHVPNGSNAPVQYRVKLKRLGLKPGVGDLLFLLGEGKLGVIELKTETGVLSDDQEEFEIVCDRLGVDYRVCRSIDDVTYVLRIWQLI